MRKLISPLNVQANRRTYKKPFKYIPWLDSDTLDGKELKFQPCFF